MVEDFPRVLILSNDPLSKESGNGRSLGNFFQGWPREKLANLHTNRQSLDLIDAQYFFLSDAMVKNHLLHFKKPGEVEFYPLTVKATDPSVSSRAVKKNPLTCLIRDGLWRSGLYSSKALKKWIADFHPEIVLLQAGDFPFMFDWARKIAKKQHAKLVIFNTEDYYFKTWNYMGKEAGHSKLYPWLHSRFKKSFSRAIKSTSLCLYHFSGLEELYHQTFPKVPSQTIYVSSDVSYPPYQAKNGIFKAVYAGNLSGGRFKALDEIAEVLHQNALPYEFEVYGRAVKEEGFEAFAQSPFLHYKGETSYNEVSQALEDADLVVHAVSFDPFQNKDRQNEFSSKIPDCLSSGRPFLVYAPESLGFVHYLQDNHCAFVATNRSELSKLLLRLVNDIAFRESLLPNAALISKQNHNVKTNAEKLRVSLASLAK